MLGVPSSPLIAQALTQSTGTVLSVTGYLTVTSLISVVASLVSKDHTNEPLYTVSSQLRRPAPHAR